MSKLNVKNGTPVGNVHLCRGCSNGQYTVGYRESEVLVVCTNSSPARVVPFVVYECTEFHDRSRPDWEQMEKLALSFTDDRRKPTPGFRRNGFGSVPAVVEDEEEKVVKVARLRE